MLIRYRYWCFWNGHKMYRLEVVRMEGGERGTLWGAGVLFYASKYLVIINRLYTVTSMSTKQMNNLILGILTGNYKPGIV